MIVYVAIITIKTLYRYFFRTSLVFLAITSHGPYNSLEKNMPSNFYLKYFTPIILPFPIFIARNTFFQLYDILLSPPELEECYFVFRIYYSPPGSVT